MTQTIEQLTARVRELEEENARLARINSDICAKSNRGVITNARLEEQLAASQADAEQLREALTACVCAMQDYQAGIGITEMFDKGERLGRKALALPRDTSALDAYVSEKVKEAVSTQKEYYESVFQDGAKRIANLTKQRDLAVDAASVAAVSLETIQLRSFGEESYLDSKPQMRAFAGARAKIARDIISTIQESEAMAQGEK